LLDIISQDSDEYSVFPHILVTPTPASAFAQDKVDPPSGWVIAGVLVIILVAMLYQSFKKLIASLFRKK
jgi:hypothetical protein